jgi:hypothetical protein
VQARASAPAFHPDLVAAACGKLRACATTFPSTESGGLVWAWMCSDDNDGAARYDELQIALLYVSRGPMSMLASSFWFFSLVRHLCCVHKLASMYNASLDPDEKHAQSTPNIANSTIRGPDDDCHVQDRSAQRPC